MKKFNGIIAGFIGIYVVLAAVFFILFQRNEEKEDLKYKIELPV